MTLYLLALLLGVIAGFRAMSAPAMVSWAAYFGWLDLSATWLAFLGNAWTRGILTLLALVELVTDQLPSTPSRTGPVQFGARVAAGALSGAAVGASGGAMIGGLLAGIIGAIIGTLGGRAFRARLATAQAYTLAYIDGFITIAWLCAGIIVLIALMKRTKIYFDAPPGEPPKWRLTRRRNKSKTGREGGRNSWRKRHCHAW